MGPLTGFRIVELAGIGPGPFCGMMLSDMGAEVIRIDRPGSVAGRTPDVLARNRLSIAVDLKKPEGVETVLRLAETADAIFEGFRPGVTERLGLGPDDCMARNPKLVYGRMTGWGQDGPMAEAAGHDINYIGLAGALHAIGRPEEKPVPPLNMVGDFGGRGMLLAFGLVCGMLEAQKSGKGQVVDAAMVDGAASLMTMVYGLHAAGAWKEERQSNLLDGGAPFYTSYRTKDDRYMAVAPIESRFYKNLLNALGLGDIDPADQRDESQWDVVRQKLQAVFASKTRDEWCELLDGKETCCTPILDMSEVSSHPHNAARKTFVSIDGITQPAPAPRFSRTESEISSPAGHVRSDLHQVLKEWGASKEILANLSEEY